MVLPVNSISYIPFERFSSTLLSCSALTLMVQKSDFHKKETLATVP